MKIVINIFIFTLFVLELASQTSVETIQNTKVRELNSNKKPIPGVQVKYTSAIPTTSDQNGLVRIAFQDIAPGSKAFLIDISKAGFELVNDREIEVITLTNTNRLNTDIIMAKIGVIEAAKKEYYNISDESLVKNFEKEKQRYKNDLKNLKISQQQYAREIARLNEANDQQKKELNVLAERFARTNFDDVSSVYRDALLLYKSGKIDSVLFVLKNLDLKGQVNELLNSYSKTNELKKEVLIRDSFDRKQKQNLLPLIDLEITIRKNRFEFSSTIEYIKLALTLDSTNVNYWVNLAQIYWYLSRDKEALNAYEMAFSINPQFAYGYTARAALYQKQKKYLLALSDCDRAIQIEPQNPDHYRSKASILTTLETNAGYKEALTLISKAIELSPKNGSLYNERAYILACLNNKEQSLKDLNFAIQLNPEESNIHFTKSRIFLKEGEIDNALTEMGYVIDLDSNDFKSYYLRGSLYSLKKDYQSALRDFNKSIDLNPSFASSYAQRAETWLVLNNLESANNDLILGMELDSNDYNLLVISGKINTLLAKYDVAEKSYTKAILVKPDAKLYSERALVYFYLSNLERGILDVDSAILLSPEVTELYLLRMTLSYQAGKWDKSILDATYILSKQPECDDCKFYRGVSNSKLEKYTESLSDFRDLINKGSSYAPDAYYRRGESYRKLKDFTNAELDLKKALVLLPEMGHPSFFMAMLQADLGNISLFYEYLENSIIKAIPYPLIKRLSSNDEPILKKFEKEARFQEILKKAKK